LADLARFLFQSGHFSAGAGRVRPHGFNPGNRTDLSTFDVQGLDDPAKQDLGDQVANLQARPLKARAELPLTALDDLPLEFVRVDMPIERHGNILGFPLGDDAEAKSARLELATALANSATLHI